MNKLQIEEGFTIESFDGRFEIIDGAWRFRWNGNRGSVDAPSGGEQAILDRLTEIVKPLRTHKIEDTVYREDGYAMFRGCGGWEALAGLEKQIDLFHSWGWPIPAHMEDK